MLISVSIVGQQSKPATIAASRIVNASVFGAPVITKQGEVPQTIAATPIINASTFGAPVVAQPVVEAWGTFLANQKYDTAILSNGNLTIGTNATGGGVAVGPPANTGKKYFEMTVSGSILYGGIGVVDEAHSWAAAGPDQSPTVGSCVLSKNAGKVYLDNVQQAGKGSTFSNGSVVQIAVDISAKLFWCKVNNAGDWNTTVGADPATGVGGISLATFGPWVMPWAWVYATPITYTINCGASAWAYTPPAGYTGWKAKTDYTPTTLLHVNGSCVLSNGNLTATCNAAVNWSHALGLWSRSGGKYFFSCRVDNASMGVGGGIGVTRPRALNDASGNSAMGNSGVCYQPNGAIFINSSSSLPAAAAYVNGDIIDCAIDLDIERAWFRKNGGLWNNSATDDPATGTGGKNGAGNWVYPLNPGMRSDSATASVTFNFGPAYTYPRPAGFLNWPGVA